MGNWDWGTRGQGDIEEAFHQVSKSPGLQVSRSPCLPVSQSPSPLVSHASRSPKTNYRRGRLQKDTDRDLKLLKRHGIGDNKSITGFSRPGIKEWPNCYRAIASEPNLIKKIKKIKPSAIEQLNQLAEVGKNPSDRAARMLSDRGMKKAAKRAMQMLTGIFAGLPALTKLVETSKSVLHHLSQFFGLE